MSEEPSPNPNELVTTETKITALFVVLGLVSTLGTTAATDRQWLHFAVLLGVGVIVPTIINEWRN